MLIQTLAHFNIRAQVKKEYPGAWCGDAKIAAMGIAVKHGYTFHGFALNVNMDLSPFGLINPCGVKRMPVTSMERELGKKMDPSLVRRVLKQTLGKVFDFEFSNASIEQAGRLVPPTRADRPAAAVQAR